MTGVIFLAVLLPLTPDTIVVGESESEERVL